MAKVLSTVYLGVAEKPANVALQTVLHELTYDAFIRCLQLQVLVYSCQLKALARGAGGRGPA